MSGAPEIAGAPEASGRAGAGLEVAVLALVAIATTAALALTGGNVVAAIAPTVVVAVLWALAKAPLRTSTTVLLLLVLALDRQSDAHGLFHTPLAPLGDVLRNNLDRLFPGSKLKLNGMEVVLLLLLAVGIRRELRGDRIDAVGRVPTAPVLRGAALAYVLAILASTAWGLGRGGSVDYAIVQVRPLLHIPLLFWLFQMAYQGRRDRLTIGRVVVAAALAKAALAIYIDLTIGRHYTGPGKWACATNHGDSILFAIACVILIATALERPDRRHVRRAVGLLVVLALGMVANQRRLAWVDLALALLAIWAVSPWSTWKRRVTRAALTVAPVLALYFAVGWRSNAAIFAPVKMFRTVSDGNIDRSTLYRDIENWNLAASISRAGPLGTGFGHEYTIFLQGDDISTIFELYRVEPHNSVLGILLFAGLVGFAAIFSLFAVGIFLAVRSYRLAAAPEDRAAALSALAAIVVLFFQAYGDLGQFFQQFPVFAGLALAVSGKLAVETGAWPAPRAALRSPS